MLDVQIKELLNDQINKEIFSAYFYIDMANYYINENLNGFGNWFNVQAQEEWDHAKLFMTYLQNNGESVVLKTIEAPTTVFQDLDDPLQAVLDHETFVTQSIHHIYEVAFAKRDFRTTQFLEWFIKEQGEEEKNAGDLIKRYELFGRDGKGLYLLDTELGTRVYAPPSLIL